MAMIKTFRGEKVYKAKKKLGSMVLLQLVRPDGTKYWLDVLESVYQSEVIVTFTFDPNRIVKLTLDE